MVTQKNARRISVPNTTGETKTAIHLHEMMSKFGELYPFNARITRQILWKKSWVYRQLQTRVVHRGEVLKQQKKRI